MNDNTIESIEWHKNQLAKLLSDEIGFYKVESELDSILEKTKMKKKVLVRRGGKTFYREQEVGRKHEEKVAPEKSDKKTEEKKLTPKEKHGIYTTAYEEGVGDRESNNDRREYDSSLTNPKNERESERADGYADGWEEEEEEEEEENY